MPFESHTQLQKISFIHQVKAVTANTRILGKGIKLLEDTAGALVIALSLSDTTRKL